MEAVAGGNALPVDIDKRLGMGEVAGLPDIEKQRHRLPAAPGCGHLEAGLEHETHAPVAPIGLRRNLAPGVRRVIERDPVERRHHAYLLQAECRQHVAFAMDLAGNQQKLASELLDGPAHVMVEGHLSGPVCCAAGPVGGGAEVSQRFWVLWDQCRKRLSVGIEPVHGALAWRKAQAVAGMAIGVAGFAQNDRFAGADIDIDVAVRAELFGMDHLARPSAAVGTDVEMLGSHADAVRLELLGIGARENIHLRRADELGHEQVDRSFIEFHRRADLLDDAVLEHHDAVGQRHRLDLVVGDVDHGGVLELLVQPGDLHARCTRSAASRLESGSSNRNTLGSLTMARPMATRWR